MKSDSSVKLLLFLILVTLLYIGYQSTMIAKSVSKINNTMDSTATGGSGSKPPTPKSFRITTTDTSGTRPPTPKSITASAHADSTTTDTTSGGGAPKIRKQKAQVQ